MKSLLRPPRRHPWPTHPRLTPLQSLRSIGCDQSEWDCERQKSRLWLLTRSDHALPACPADETIPSLPAWEKWQFLMGIRNPLFPGDEVIVAAVSLLCSFYGGRLKTVRLDSIFFCVGLFPAGETPADRYSEADSWYHGATVP